MRRSVGNDLGRIESDFRKAEKGQGHAVLRVRPADQDLCEKWFPRPQAAQGTRPVPAVLEKRNVEASIDSIGRRTLMAKKLKRRKKTPAEKAAEQTLRKLERMIRRKAKREMTR